MVAANIHINEALALAREILGAEVRQKSLGRARVIGSQSGGMKVMEPLQTYANTHGQRSVERWAPFALITEVLLAQENTQFKVKTYL